MTSNISDEDATRIGHAIRDAAKLMAVPIEHDMERRAFCIKLAMETKGLAMSFKADGDWEEAVDKVLAAANKYLVFIEGDTK